MIRAFLYDAQGTDLEIDPPARLPELEAHQLLWVDVAGRDAAEIERAAALLSLKPRSTADLATAARTFTLANYGDYVHFDLAALDGRERAAADGFRPSRAGRLDVAIGRGWLLTVHEADLGFLEAFRDQDRGETLIGGLSPAALAASLLDWHLSAYMEALEEVEAFADRLDLKLLSAANVRDDLLTELVGARRHLSRLRRSLAPQRAVFYGLSRPDVAVTLLSGGDNPFHDLEHRFERTLDSLEHGRDLVQSSFDLFTTRTAETTNVLIRRLTFISILLGVLGGLAGVFGMNFDTPYAKTGLTGFWAVVGGFLLLAAAAALVGRVRKWI